MRRFVLLLCLAFAVPAFALSPGERAPELGLVDTNGEVIRMADLRGKVVIVDFWASWCGPCREELPALASLQEEFGDRLVIVGVSVDTDEGAMRRFLRRSGVRFRVARDVDQAVAGRYEPPRMPSSYVIDQEGVVRHVHAGFDSDDIAEFRSEIRALLQ